jgi:hypothetical protein
MIILMVGGRGNGLRAWVSDEEAFLFDDTIYYQSDVEIPGGFIYFDEPTKENYKNMEQKIQEVFNDSGGTTNKRD